MRTPVLVFVRVGVFGGLCSDVWSIGVFVSLLRAGMGRFDTAGM